MIPKLDPEDLEGIVDALEKLADRVRELFSIGQPFKYRDKLLTGIALASMIVPQSWAYTEQTSWTTVNYLRLYLPKNVNYIRYSALLDNSGNNDTRFRLKSSEKAGAELVNTGTTATWKDSTKSMDISDLAQDEYHTLDLQMKVSAGTGMLKGLSVYIWDGE